jgi:hypothetical protein
VLPKCFLFVLAALTTYFLTLFGAGFVRYFSLNESAQAQILQWEVIEDQRGYVLKARYAYLGHVGEYVFDSPCYLNEPAAVMALKEKAKKSYFAWYHPNKSSISFLEVHFPINYLIKTLISLSALIYFWYLFKRLKYSFG